jgi:hypothetical protein
MSGQDNETTEDFGRGSDNSAALAALTTPEALSSTGLDAGSLKEYIQTQKAEESLTDVNSLFNQPYTEEDKKTLEAYQKELIASGMQVSSTTPPEKTTDQYQLPGMLDIPASVPGLQLPGMNEGVNEEASQTLPATNNSGYLPGLGMEKEIPSEPLPNTPTPELPRETPVPTDNVQINPYWLTAVENAKAQVDLALTKAQVSNDFTEYTRNQLVLSTLYKPEIIEAYYKSQPPPPVDLSNLTATTNILASNERFEATSSDNSLKTGMTNGINQGQYAGNNKSLPDIKKLI